MCEGRISRAVQTALAVRAYRQVRFVNAQRAVAQVREVVVTRRQAGCAGDNAAGADTSAGNSSATACGRAADTRGAENFTVDEA